LLLPGLLCNRTVWEAQIAALGSDIDCRVPKYHELDSIEAMACRVLSEAPPRFALAGHSMGGRVAFEILRADPRRVTRLALLDTGCSARPEAEAGEAEARQRQHLVEVAYSSGMRAMGREWVQGMVHPVRLQDGALIESILAMIERRTPQEFAGQIRALLARPDATEVLPSIACPVVLLCGRQDTWSPLERHEAMARLIPGSRLEVVEDSGHMSPMEQPEQVSAALRRWWGE
jgi:pimeloyl-ACP methyl ester carboxylesterase